jgi:hypothetical protein
MHDERSMYRQQWPAIRQHLRRLCLERHGKVLLETLCNSREPGSEHEQTVRAAVEAWRQRILDELAQKIRAAGAWPG